MNEEIKELIAAYRKDADEFEYIEELAGQIMSDHAEKLASALSALSSHAETEGEWEYGSKGYCFDWDDRRCRFISGSLNQLLEHEEEQHLSDHSSCAVRRRKAGPWIEATK